MIRGGVPVRGGNRYERGKRVCKTVGTRLELGRSVMFTDGTNVGRGAMKTFESSTFTVGDVVAAIRDLGIRVWRSGIPRGSVGVVVEVDWLGDPRVAFTVDREWRAGSETVEKTVTDADIRRVRNAENRVTGT